MTLLREVLLRLLGRERATNDQASPSEFSYTIYWTWLARGWSPKRRLRVRSFVRETISRPDFIPNEFERRCCLADIDDLEHVGASLLALEKVLTSFIDQGTEEE